MAGKDYGPRGCCEGSGCVAVIFVGVVSIALWLAGLEAVSLLALGLP